jgi:hypothetical protein
LRVCTSTSELQQMDHRYGTVEPGTSTTIQIAMGRGQNLDGYWIPVVNQASTYHKTLTMTGVVLIPRDTPPVLNRSLLEQTYGGCTAIQLGQMFNSPLTTCRRRRLLPLSPQL